MDLLAAELMPQEDCDNAFVVGVFSLLDTLLGMPLDQALGSVTLPQPVLDALLRNEGPLAPFLALTKACGPDVGRSAGPLSGVGPFHAFWGASTASSR